MNELSNNKKTLEVQLKREVPTLGYKNCNPLNIRYSSSNKWKGLVGKDSKGFSVFSSHYYGLRAALIILRRYIFDYKLTSISDIIKRWAPSSDGNDVKSYVEYLFHCSYLLRSGSLNTSSIDFVTQVCVLVSSMAFYESNVFIHPDDIFNLITKEPLLKKAFIK